MFYLIKKRGLFSLIFSKLIIAALILAGLNLSGCSTAKKDSAPKRVPHHLDKVPDAVPKVEPLSKYGNRFKNSNTYVALKKRYAVMPTSRNYRAHGQASWYGTKFHGKRTSSGEAYNMYAMTAAHRTLPLPTYARVTNTQNGKSVVVKINDRGPFHKNRIIDLSYVAAHKLGILGKGTGHVEVVSIDPRDHNGKVPDLKHLRKESSKQLANQEVMEPVKSHIKQKQRVMQSNKAANNKAVNKLKKQSSRERIGSGKKLNKTGKIS